MIIAIALVLAVFAGDYYLGQEVNAAIFYLVPILIAGWYVGIGLAIFMEPPGSVDEMQRAADSLMYAVKREGKDNVKMEVVGR